MDDRLKQWLFNLNCLYNNILNASTSYRELYRSFDHIGVDLMSDVDAVFIAYILIFTNSFIDESNLSVGSNVISTRKVCSPAFKYINLK